MSYRAMWDRAVLDGQRHGTEAYISRAVLEELPYVREVIWTRSLSAVPAWRVRLRLPWWAWLTLGLLHFHARREGRRIIHREKPAGALVAVTV